MKTQHIRKVINSVRKKGLEVTTDSIIAESLFYPGGTLSDSDKGDILEVFWQIREEIERKVNKKYPSGSGITGLAYGIAVNDYFNRPKKQ